MAKVVTLGPVNTPTTFEEAFGEFSEVRGRGRARRAKRVADRQEKRKERKLGRVSARDEVKAARQESRIGRRATRKERRQAIRDEQQAARQGRRDVRAERSQDRRDMRTERRMGRRDMRNPEEENLQNGLDTGVGNEMMDQETTQGGGGGYDTQGAYDQGGSDAGYAPSNDGGGYDDQGGYDQGGYDEGSSDSYDRVGAGAPSGNYQGQGPAEYGEDEMPYDETGSEDYAEDGYSDEGGEDYANDGGYLMDYAASDDFNFDGVMGAEDRFSELSDAEETSYIDNLADNYVGSKAAIASLERRRRDCGSPFERQEISRQIIAHKKNLQEVKSKLEGESSADGQDNRMQIHRAMKKAHMKHRRRQSRPVTRVQSNLNPAFGRNRIVVPGKSNADGTPTGLNGLDLMNDYDAPRVREIQLGADGSQTSKGLGWGAVIGAVAIGAIAFWAVERYKLLK